MTEYFTKDGDDYVKVDETLHTQADLDKVVKDRAERLARQQYADYDELKEKAGKVDTVTKEYEDKLKAKGDEVTTLQGDLKKAKLETTKSNLVREFKLSDEQAEFMEGDDEDALRKRAEKLSKLTGGGGVNIQKNKKPEGKATDSKALAGKLFSSKKSDD